MDNTLSVISTLAAASLVAVLAVQCINSGVEGFAEDSASGIPEVSGVPPAVSPPEVSSACALLPISSSLLPNEEWTTDGITLSENPLMMGMTSVDIIGSDPAAGSLSFLSHDIRGSHYPAPNTHLPIHLSGKCLPISPSILASTQDSLDLFTTTDCLHMNDPTKM